MLVQSEERFSPEMRGDIAREHVARYSWAFGFMKPEFSVLDIACGEGYGSHILSGVAGHVSGFDLSPECIAHAQEKYGGNGERLYFCESPIEAIAALNEAFDAVVSFETIEHTDDVDSAFDELRRVLKPDGLLIISTPDKLQYSDRTGHKNPFHKHEMYRDEFEEMLLGRFRYVSLFGQRVLHGSLIMPAGSLADGFTYTHWTGAKLFGHRSIPETMYWIAVASNQRITDLPATFHTSD